MTNSKKVPIGVKKIVLKYNVKQFEPDFKYQSPYARRHKDNFMLVLHIINGITKDYLLELIGRVSD